MSCNKSLLAAYSVELMKHLCFLFRDTEYDFKGTSEPPLLSQRNEKEIGLLEYMHINMFKLTIASYILMSSTHS